MNKNRVFRLVLSFSILITLCGCAASNTLIKGCGRYKVRLEHTTKSWYVVKEEYQGIEYYFERNAFAFNWIGPALQQGYFKYPPLKAEKKFLCDTKEQALEQAIAIAKEEGGIYGLHILP